MGTITRKMRSILMMSSVGGLMIIDMLLLMARSLVGLRMSSIYPWRSCSHSSVRL